MKLPIDVHEDTLPDGTTGRAVLKETRLLAESITEFAQEVGNEGPLLAEQTQPRVEKQIARLDAAINQLDTEAQNLHKAFDSRFVLDRQDPAINFIVEHIKKQKSPLTALNKLIAEGDRRALSVVLALPYYVIGLKPEELATLRNLALQKLEPDINEKLMANENARAKVQRAQEVFSLGAVELLKPSAKAAAARKAIKERMG